MKALAIIMQQKEASILGKLTRWEYKEEDGKLEKHKVRMTMRGDHQQVEGFNSSDLYAPVLKAYEALLLLSIAAAEGSIGNDVV